MRLNLKLKQCIICNTEFKPTNGKSLTCNPKCSYKRKRKYDKEYMKDNAEKQSEWSRKSIKKNKKRVNKYAKIRYQRDKGIIKVRNDTNRLLRKLGVKKEGKCMDCHKTRKLEIHHITYTVDDFILLCKKCHMKRHKKRLYVQ